MSSSVLTSVPTLILPSSGFDVGSSSFAAAALAEVPTPEGAAPKENADFGVVAGGAVFPLPVKEKVVPDDAGAAPNEANGFAADVSVALVPTEKAAVFVGALAAEPPNEKAGAAEIVDAEGAWPLPNEKVVEFDELVFALEMPFPVGLLSPPPS
mmetsp:Transcript_25491/g.60684  ORF Transcript_25491/g.60684 Transcript_25491/m.60684 type:complete len:154 (-) Transcript_25491:784-1245(-)